MLRGRYIYIKGFEMQFLSQATGQCFDPALVNISWVGSWAVGGADCSRWFSDNGGFDKRRQVGGGVREHSFKPFVIMIAFGIKAQGDHLILRKGGRRWQRSSPKFGTSVDCWGDCDPTGIRIRNFIVQLSGRRRKS